MKSLCFRSGLLLQFLFLFICCLIILTSDSAIGEDEPESSITDLNEWSNNLEGSITVVWKANDDDFDISTIYFWVCHAEDSDSCKNNAFNEWKLVESHVLTEPKNDVEGYTHLLWNVIFSKLDSTETEGAYKIITCSVNGNGTNEYGDKGCDKYDKSSDDENVKLFDTGKMKDFGFDSVSPVLFPDPTVSGEDWLDINDTVIIGWDGFDRNSGITSVDIRYCHWETVLSENFIQGLWGKFEDWEESEGGNTSILTVSDDRDEGLYYFYPILVDSAGNPSDDISCSEKIDETLAFDKTQPEANIQPGINGKFAYNNEALISLSVSDNIELKDVVLRYGYNGDFDEDLFDSSFSDGNLAVIPIKDLSGMIAYEDSTNFIFPDGQGTYRFFLQVDDKNPTSQPIEVKLTLIYDTEAPVSQIVFSGEEPDLTNNEEYEVDCTTIDPNHEVGLVNLYFRYKESESHTFGNWSNEATSISYSGICRIGFESFSDGDGFYQFYTKAIDKAGNIEIKDATPELTIINDRTSPDFNLLYLQSEHKDLLALGSNTVYYKGIDFPAEIKFVGSLSDSLSGIDGNIEYSEFNWALDSDLWNIDFVFNASKSQVENTITLTVSDLAGNPSEIVISFEEDNLPPPFFLYNTVLDEMINEEKVLLVKSGVTAVSISGVPESGAPIELYELRFWESGWILLDSPSFQVPEGESNLSIRVTDSLGNTITKTFNVEHDNEGPEFESLANWYSNDNITYLSGSVQVRLSASDASSGSGLDRIEFRYENDGWQEYNTDTGDSLDLFSDEKVSQLNFSYRGIDRLGNINEYHKTFELDTTTTHIDFELINFTFVPNSGNASFWNGSADAGDDVFNVDYNSFNILKLYPDFTNISAGETGSGIKTILIEYSRDNVTWMEYNPLTGIELTSPSLYIRINVTDNVSNSMSYVVETPIKVSNYPIKKEPEAEGNGFWVMLLLVVIAGSVVAYKYREKQLQDTEKEESDVRTKTVEQGPPPIKCPKCSVLIPAESKSCAFCGTGWDDVGNLFLVNPFADSKKQITKEIIPRTGEILIGSNLDRWKIETGARSSIGGRENNEDSISWNTFLRTTSDIPHSIRLGIVADGVGGHNKGEIASSIVISAINKSVSKSVNDPFHTEVFTSQEHAKILESAYHYGNDIVFGKSQNDEYRGMATTAVSVYLWEDDNENNGFLIGNVGDSRGYLINKEEIKQVTKDDSEVQKLIDEGQITVKEAKTHPRKNVITQAIGNKKTIKPRIETYNLRNSEFDCILLCSDGVSDKITDKEIHKIVNQFDNPQDVCNKIVKVINRTNTNHDNVSLILIKLPNLFAGDY